MKKTFADILREQDRSREAKVASKLPSWSGAAGLVFPTSLCLEQCSGEAAALHKSALVRELAGGPGFRIADLTGGLGVDSWAFSREAGAVFYNERDAALRAAVSHNFTVLDVHNVQFHGFDISPSNEDWLSALRLFGPDIIYADPARRGSAGQKVFLPQDCEPDVLLLLPSLKALAPLLIFKLSPMADISAVAKAFRPKEIQVVGQNGEVKELLCIIDGSEPVEPIVRAVEGGEEFVFTKEEESSAPLLIGTVGPYLYEPKAVLLKAGAFRICCSRFNLTKLATSTRLYTSDELLDVPLFKRFEVLELRPFRADSLRGFGRTFPHADVSACNIPMSSDELRARMGIKPGPSEGIHIFGCETSEGRTLIAAKRLQPFRISSTSF